MMLFIYFSTSKAHKIFVIYKYIKYSYTIIQYSIYNRIMIRFKIIIK